MLVRWSSVLELDFFVWTLNVLVYYTLSILTPLLLLLLHLACPRSPFQRTKKHSENES